MITALVAAALLQSSAIPAQCRLDNSLPDACAIVFATEPATSMVGVGFVFEFGTVIVAGPKRNDSSFNVEIMEVGDVAVTATSGHCTITAKRIACTVNVENHTFKIEAVAQ